MKTMNHIAIRTGSLLLIPPLLLLLAIWHWKPGAFILAVVLLFVAVVLSYRLVRKNVLSNKAYRLGICLAIFAVLLLIWMNVAVGGILGDNPANMMYFGVIFVGFIGAVITDLEPKGMSQSFLATSPAMLLFPAIALIIGKPAFSNGTVAVFALHAFYAMLFAGSAMLFRKAANKLP